jgi:hypothetical protein
MKKIHGCKDKKKIKVTSININNFKEWLTKKHYAKRMCSVSYAFGLFIDGDINGVCTFGKPASNALCIGVCGKKNSSFVYELNRLCVNDNLPENTLSKFLSKCLKMLPPLIVVSYADTSMNHTGYIYQATNWIYTGLSAKRTERYDVNNPQKHSKTITDSKNINYFDLAVRQRARKHRYIYFTGNKRFKKKWLKDLKYNILNYPKGINKRYDASYVPSNQITIL